MSDAIRLISERIVALRQEVLTDLNRNIFEDGGSYKPPTEPERLATRRERIKAAIGALAQPEHDYDW